MLRLYDMVSGATLKKIIKKGISEASWIPQAGTKMEEEETILSNCPGSKCYCKNIRKNEIFDTATCVMPRTLPIHNISLWKQEEDRNLRDKDTHK